MILSPVIGKRISLSVINTPVVLLIICSETFLLVLLRSKFAIINSKGRSKHRDITITNGNSDEDLYAYSVGDISPNTKLPLLFISVKLPAKPLSSGLRRFPSSSTGICFIIEVRAYLL